MCCHGQEEKKYYVKDIFTLILLSLRDNCDPSIIIFSRYFLIYESKYDFKFRFLNLSKIGDTLTLHIKSNYCLVLYFLNNYEFKIQRIMLIHLLISYYMYVISQFKKMKTLKMKLDSIIN